MWASVVALAIAAGGGAVAIAATGNDTGAATRTIVATQALVPVPVQSEGAPGAAKPKPKPSPSLVPARTGGLVIWPGGNRYTIVVSSLPLSSGPGLAKARAAEAVRAGLRDVGVLISSSYAGLHPGLYLIFSGIYNTREEAQSDLPQVTPRFPSAYAQQIAR